MTAVKGVLLGVRFVLEIAALVALGYWGFETAESTAAELLLGLGLPLLAAVIWGLFVSPKARYGTPLRQAVFEAVVFAAAVAALLDAGQTGLAVAFAAVAIADGVLVRVTD
jgi:hypothetical protein